MKYFLILLNPWGLGPNFHIWAIGLKIKKLGIEQDLKVKNISLRPIKNCRYVNTLVFAKFLKFE